jgi:RNA polymerase sigma factor (sigma-70 family)
LSIPAIHTSNIKQNLPDSELNQILAACLKNEAVAYRKLYERYYPYILGICVRYAQVKEDAEDMMQEVFVSAFTKLNTLKDIQAFPLWIKRIAVNTCISYVSQKKILWVMLNEKLNATEMEQGEDLSVKGLTPEVLHEEIAKLPYGYRVVLNLYAIEGLSHKEIAEQLRISEITSRTQYMKAKKILKVKLDTLIDKPRK